MRVFEEPLVPIGGEPSAHENAALVAALRIYSKRTVVNDAFTVLTAGTRNGSFTSFSYPSNVVTLQLRNTANSVILSVTAIPDPLPLLFTPEIIGAEIKLTWTALSNRTHQLEFNPDLTPTNWTALPGDVITLSNTASKLDVMTSSNRLYRVRLIP